MYRKVTKTPQGGQFELPFSTSFTNSLNFKTFEKEKYLMRNRSVS